MPLIKKTLEEAIEAVFEAESKVADNPEQSRKRISKGLATAIDAYIRSGLVTVAVTGASGTGAIT